MSILNSTVLERAWLSATSDYQQRIPNPSTSSYADHVASLFDPMNNDLFNVFSGLLNGLIGTTIESDLFENPLAVLKKPAIRFGNSERAVAVHYLQAHSYRCDSETLLQVEKPEFSEWFYSVGTPRRYDFSWNRYELERAFSADGYGFEDLLTATITQAYSSANYDEMNIMLQMFAEADARMGGLFRYQLSAFPSDEATAKELLKAIRTVAGRMKFPTTLYNHIPVPVHERGDGLVLFITPDALSSISVDSLASAFNLSYAEVQYRTILVPEFPLPNICAALCSEDFIYVRDVRFGIEPPFYNPENLTYKYYLHVAQMIGVNPAANCVLFGTDANTVIPTITQAVTGMTLTAESATADPGDEVKIEVALTGTVTGSDGEVGCITVQPNSAMFSIAAVDSNADPVELNTRTLIDSYGVLHIQKSGLESGTVITVTGTATYINPSGVTTTYTDSETVTIN